MAETLDQKHLRVYSSEALTQKFRSEHAYNEYLNSEYKLRNAILDENNFLNKLIASDPSGLSKIEIAKKRKERNESVRSDVNRYISATKVRIEELSNALQVHLYEYSNNEISSAGFITHTIVSDYMCDNDEERKVLAFDEPSKAEYGISNSLDKWRDASKMKIFMRKK